MEDEWKGIVENIVKSGSWQNPNTGEPWVPTSDMLDPVESVIKAMEDELGEQKDTNTNIMGNHAKE